MYTREELKEFTVGLKALSKYNRLTYKHIIFKVLPELSKGNLLGTQKGDIYKLDVSQDKKFSFVYGKIYLIYKVIPEQRKLVLTSIEPYETLHDLYSKLQGTYRGIPVIQQKDMFKARLFDIMGSGKK